MKEKRISSPEQLTDYIRVTNPGIWAVLISIVLLLGGLFVWSVVGTLETKTQAKVIVRKHTAEVITRQAGVLSSGMPLRVADESCVISSTKQDAYGRSIGVAEVTLTDGTYDGIVVTEQIHPISFLLESN